MMPELRALFDLPRRFLPGLGARVHGYADKKGIEGIQATGANGVFTLGRSETSGTIPSLGTDEEPAALRAGPGVRIHGYGGIHTLERLPVAAPPEEIPLGPARLEWEIETFKGNATICSLWESAVDPGNWVIIDTFVVHNTKGSYVDTVTASGVVSSYGPSDPPPADCDFPVYDSTVDFDFDYGDFVNSESSESIRPFSSLANPAITAIGLLSSRDSYHEWNSKTWRDVSTKVIPFSSSLGEVGVYFDVHGAEAHSVRFRLHNRGSCGLRVDCGYYGSGLSGGATDIDYDILLVPNQSSDWIEAPAIDSDGPLKFRFAEIRRVRMGRWRFIT